MPPALDAAGTQESQAEPHVVSLLSVRAQDKLEPFPSDVAYRLIEAELGAPVGAMFSQLSAEPVAAASLGQVGCKGAATLPPQDGHRQQG